MTKPDTTTTNEDTIVACATASGRAGIAVIRLSGPAAFCVVAELTRQQLPPARMMVLRSFYHPLSQSKTDGPDRIDQGMAVIFPGPKSYTGEDMAECHCHGSPAVISSLLRACCASPHVRQAKAGEFTRRAVLNGKQDLYQAEALLDLIDAETEEQRKQAIKGQDTVPLVSWRDSMAGLLAQAEADIDFAESEDLSIASWRQEIRNLRQALAKVIDDRRARAIREGVRVVLVGPPNVGKSSLYNKLLAREAAIVSHRAGTTRDRLEAVMDIAGFKVLLSDTAGIQDSANELDQAGVARTRSAVTEADIVIVMTSPDVETLDDPLSFLKQSKGDGAGMTQPWLLLVNKSDLVNDAKAQASNPDGAIAISVISGHGMAEFHDALETLIRKHFTIPVTSALITRQRHLDVLNQVMIFVKKAEEEQNIELLAECLRQAYNSLDMLTHQGGMETILDHVFSQYCIGK